MRGARVFGLMHRFGVPTIHTHQGISGRKRGRRVAQGEKGEGKWEWEENGERRGGVEVEGKGGTGRRGNGCVQEFIAHEFALEFFVPEAGHDELILREKPRSG